MTTAIPKEMLFIKHVLSPQHLVKAYFACAFTMQVMYLILTLRDRVPQEKLVESPGSHSP